MRLLPWPNSAAATISLQGLIVHWKKRYEGGGLVEGPSQSENALSARTAELERRVGKELIWVRRMSCRQQQGFGVTPLGWTV